MQTYAKKMEVKYFDTKKPLSLNEDSGLLEYDITEFIFS